MPLKYVLNTPGLRFKSPFLVRVRLWWSWQRDRGKALLLHDKGRVIEYYRIDGVDYVTRVSRA